MTLAGSTSHAPPPNLAFGHGARYRLGAPLARIELQAVLSQLTSCCAAMRLAVPEDEQSSTATRWGGSLARLPVTW